MTTPLSNKGIEFIYKNLSTKIKTPDLWGFSSKNC